MDKQRKVDMINNMLDQLNEALKSLVEDKEVTISYLKMGDIAAKVSAKFVDDLVKNDAIDKEDSLCILSLLADYYTELADAIFEGDKDEKSN